MQTNFRLALQLLAAFAVILAGLLLSMFTTTTASIGPQTKSLFNARQLATGCKLYAIDHGGRFPMHLAELEPDYITDVKSLRCTVSGKENDPKYLTDWLYFGGGCDDDHLPIVLIASPQASTTHRAQMRIVIGGDIAGSVILEDKYQQRLTETVHQIHALDDAQHTGKPAGVKKSPE